jgi:hypothetical protein
MIISSFLVIYKIKLHIIKTYYLKEENFMEEKQKINCSVESCEYNNIDNQKCTLKEILVAPTRHVNSEETDESQCASYRHLEDK